MENEIKATEKKSKSEKLKSYLKEIGWNYRNCGCGIFQIISCHKKGTDVLFDDHSLWIEDDGKIFGKDARKNKYFTMAIVRFTFDKCKIEKDDEFISVSSKGTFIMFRKDSKTKKDK